MVGRFDILAIVFLEDFSAVLVGFPLWALLPVEAELELIIAAFFPLCGA